MKDDQLGAIALIAGAAGGLVTMILHPTGHDLFAPGQLAPAAFLAAAVHALAIASMPVSFLGALALSRRVESPLRLAVAGLVVYAFALAAEMMAAIVSGFVGPGLVREIIDAEASAGQAWRIVFDYNQRLNQEFARTYAVASSAAIVLWSASILRSQSLAPGVAIYGLLVGPVIVLGVLSGHLRLNVHGFGLIVLAQAVWFVVAGALLGRLKKP
jgi:hypothetical protein